MRTNRINPLRILGMSSNVLAEKGKKGSTNIGTLCDCRYQHTRRQAQIFQLHDVMPQQQLITGSLKVTLFASDPSRYDRFWCCRTHACREYQHFG